MKAIIWKELRENFKWSALLLLAMGFAVVLIFWPTAYAGLLRNRLLSGDFRALTAFGFCGTGWALGLVHTYRETRRDRWAFFVHRPATLTHLFFGKVIAGLLLYLLVTAGPLVGAILWTATPGNIPAPFEWRMTLPLVADTLAGILFYLAGMIIGLRQAPWFGSRALALLPAILGGLLATSTQTFGESLAWTALFLVVEMIAAWGCFISGGQYRSQPTAAKTSLGLILLISFTAISSLAFTVGVGLLAERRPGVTWDYYQTTGNGQIVHVTKTIGRHGRTILTRVEDLNGEPVAGYPIGVPGSAYVSPTVSAVVRSDWPHSGDDSYRSANRYFRFVQQGGGFVWYYVPRKGRIEQYSEETRRPVGSIGPDGFVPIGVETTERFEGGHVTRIGHDNQLLAFQQTVYRIDFLQGTVTEILAVKPDEPILHVGDFDVPGKRLYGLALGTENEFAIIDGSGDVFLRLPFEYNCETYPNVTLFMGSNLDRFYVWYSPARSGVMRAERDALRDVIVEISDEGKELARYTIPSRLTYPPSDPPTYAGLFGSVFPIILPIVLIGYNLACVFAGSMEAHLWLEGIVREVTQMGPSFTSLFGISLLVSIVVCVLVCVVIGRRYAFNRRRIGWWCVVMVLSGPAGLLTMRSLLD